MRRIVTFDGISLSCRMCASPSRRYSGVTVDTVVVSAIAADVEQRRQCHADADCDREIRQYRQSKCRDPHRDIRLRQPNNCADLSPLAHVVGNDEQHGRQCRQRNKSGQGRRDQQNRQQRQRMDHPRDRGLGAGADIRRRARDGAGRGYAAEHRRDDIRHALCHQLHIGFVVISAHAVSNDGRQQAFDGGEQCDRERRRKQRQDVGGVETRELQMAESPAEYRRTLFRSFRSADESRATTAVASSSATIEPGTRVVSFGQNTMIASEAAGHNRRSAIATVPAW